MNPRTAWNPDYKDAFLQALWHYALHQYVPMKEQNKELFSVWQHAFSKNHKWLLVSGLQKSIRRNAPLSSLLYLHALHHTDAAYGRYRLGICAIEESAGAHPALALSVLHTKVSAKNLRAIEEQCAQWALSAGFSSQEHAPVFDALSKSEGLMTLCLFAQQMSSSPKERSACNLMGISAYCLEHPPKAWTPEKSSLLTSYGALEPQDHIEQLGLLAQNAHVDIRARYAALGLLCAAYPSPLTQEASLKDLARTTFTHVNQQLAQTHPYAGASSEKMCMLQQLAEESCGFGTDNFGMSLALVHQKQPMDFQTTQEYWQQCTSLFLETPWNLGTPNPVAGSIFTDAVKNAAPSSYFLPEALDKHTAEGRRLLEQWMHQHKTLTDLVASMPYAERTHALGSALFWLEGHVCTPTLETPLHQSSIAASRLLCAKQFGVPWDKLSVILQEYLPSLTALRQKTIESLFTPAPTPSVKWLI